MAGLYSRSQKTEGPVHAGGRNDPYAPAQSIVEVILPRTADAAHSYLDDAFHPGHFTCAPHRAGNSMAQAASLFTPVEVRIDLNNCDWSARLTPRPR